MKSKLFWYIEGQTQFSTSLLVYQNEFDPQQNDVDVDITLWAFTKSLRNIKGVVKWSGQTPNH